MYKEKKLFFDTILEGEDRVRGKIFFFFFVYLILLVWYWNKPRPPIIWHLPPFLQIEEALQVSSQFRLRYNEFGAVSTLVEVNVYRRTLVFYCTVRFLCFLLRLSRLEKLVHSSYILRHSQHQKTKHTNCTYI